MKIKDNTISLAGLTTQALFAMNVANEIYKKHGLEFVITSVNDGKHSDTSLHHSGNAFDCRRYDDDQYMLQLRDEIKEALRIDFDVILEGNHLHIEYQPRQK